MMVYQKNVPGWERAVRIVAAVGLVGYAWAGHLPLLASAILTSAAVALVVTGFVGWCPACAMVGRRLSKGKATLDFPDAT